MFVRFMSDLSCINAIGTPFRFIWSGRDSTFWSLAVFTASHNVLLFPGFIPCRTLALVSFMKWYLICNIKEPALEVQSRTAPSVEAHHHVNDPNRGRNFGGRQIKKL